MKILQINNVYGTKSTGNLTRALHRGLQEAGEESLVVFGRGKGTGEPGIIRLCPEWYGKVNAAATRLTGMIYGGCVLSTWRLLKILRREKPDVVHLQCVNGSFVNIYRLLSWLKRRSIPTVVSLHAEFYYTGSCSHAFECDQWQHGCAACPKYSGAARSLLPDRTAKAWKKMQAAFSGLEECCVICPVSPWVKQRAEKADILKGFRLCTVGNGVDTSVFRWEDTPKEPNKTVVHVTTCFCGDATHLKGGATVLALARRMPEVTFLVAGKGERSADLPENVTLLGVVEEPEHMAALYRRANVTLVTSKRETFSMPCGESLCCGTPVVGFRAGGPESIALAEHSGFVEQGDLDGLEQMLRRWLERDPDREKIAAEGAAAYSAEKMVEQYIGIYRSML